MAKSKGRFTKGHPHAAVRSRRWCYDCYLGGPVDRQGYTTCKLRSTIIPETVPDEQRRVLPQELRWPERDHANAHEMVDAVLERDIAQMESWLQLHSGHHFGFEDYLVWCRDQTGLAVTELISRPMGKPHQVDRIARLPGLGDYLVDIHMLRYPRGDAWARATLWCPGRGAGTVLSRYLIELRTGHEILEEHYPGRWLALGFPDLSGEEAIRIHRRLIRPRRPLERSGVEAPV